MIIVAQRVWETVILLCLEEVLAPAMEQSPSIDIYKIIKNYSTIRDQRNIKGQVFKC